MELREVRAFIAVVEEGGLSAAARRLHLSQPAISQTISALERQLGVQLLVRSSSGVRATEAGLTLLAEARTLVDRHDYAVAAVTQRGEESSVLRLGIPLELPADLLTRPVTELAAAYPHTRIQARHLSTCEQLMALYTQNLDVGLLRERPVGQALDAVLLTEEHLGVLLSAKEAVEIVEPNGVRLDVLSGLSWVGFPRSGSPAWYDEVTAVLRSHGVDPGGESQDSTPLIAEVKLATVAAGGAFALAPPNWSQPIPEVVSWHPLISSPLVRRTWAAWSASSRRRDLGHFIASFEGPTCLADRP
jgi:DNA-binding transcriptional LysR family regulator